MCNRFTTEHRYRPKSMNRKFVSRLLLLASLLLMPIYMMFASGKDGENDVVWSGTKAFNRRVESFKIKPDEASKIAWKEWEKVKHPIARDPGFIVGRWYWFGKETK